MGRRVKEAWKAIPDYPGYFVSNHGNVRGKSGKILKRLYSERGGNYPFINLTRREESGKTYRKNETIHALVAAFFIGPRPEGMVVHHKDSNRKNCYFKNLEYITQLENMRLSNRHKKKSRRRKPGGLPV